MRKITAIFLILVLLFNTAGYRMAISFIDERQDQRLETLLDNHEYEESELMEIRVELNMPYQQRFTEFERHYGELNIDGHTYTYVKRKIEGDVAIFKCIANPSKQQLSSLHDEMTLANSNADMDQPGSQQKQNSFAKNIGAEYDEQMNFAMEKPFSHITIKPGAHYLFRVQNTHLNTPHQPPEFIS